MKSKKYINISLQFNIDKLFLGFWDLDREIRELFPKKFYNGIDRINNNEGYTGYNSIPCCKICNRMKVKLEVSEFLTTAFNIYKYLHSRGVLHS